MGTLFPLLGHRKVATLACFQKVVRRVYPRSGGADSKCRKMAQFIGFRCGAAGATLGTLLLLIAGPASAVSVPAVSSGGAAKLRMGKDVYGKVRRVGYLVDIPEIKNRPEGLETTFPSCFIQ